MCPRHDDWFSELFRELDPDRWAGRMHRQWGRKHRRGPVFESGEMKYVILRLLREKPRHGYEVIKEIRSDRFLCKVPVVAVTAYAMVGDREKLMAGLLKACEKRPVSAISSAWRWAAAGQPRPDPHPAASEERS